MKLAATKYLRCPLTLETLQLITTKTYDNSLLPQGEIEEGYFFSASGMYYPIIGGIPRMLPESMVAHKERLKNWMPDFPNKLTNALEKFGTAIQISSGRNKKIQETFGFEWGLLNKGKNIKIWNHDRDSYKRQLVKELDIQEGQTFALSLDAGCGHGRSAVLMAEFSETVFGVEVSHAVELGYEENNRHNCHFVQADVHHLPFERDTFNLLYSSGVLHHNPNTLAALRNVSSFLAPNGMLCIWLYHPFKNLVHWCMRNYRYITRNLHVKVVYAMNNVSITPVQWIVSQLSKKKKKWTEIGIEQLDMLTPKYRHEHPQEEVQGWLKDENYKDIKITDTDNYGFSIKAIKS